MGNDFWPYGVEPNRRAITAMLDYARRHGTTRRALTLEELFSATTLTRHAT
jgi:4,5-dihydroxyphthalate decarboxylase